MAQLMAAVIFTRWQEMTEPQLEKFMEDYKKGEKKEEVEMACRYFTNTRSYQKGETDTNPYKICCEMVDYCSFYYQTWFYLLCAAVVVFLLIIIGIVFVCCCCRKGRGGGGAESDDIEETP
ncbi:unnamed protein product [Caenorhabditis brenneri]